MNPFKISIFAILLTGGILTLLLVNNESNQPVRPESNLAAAERNAKLLSEQLNENLSILKGSLKSLSFNTYWQTSPVAEWSFWLNSQKALYQAAGLSLLGVHSLSNNVISFEKPSRPGQLSDLKNPLQRLYENQSEVNLLQVFRGSPAIVTLTPIKNVENDIIGALIGIKYLDTKALKQFHHLTQVPVAVINGGEIKAISIDSSPDLNSFDRVDITWPEGINSSLWKLSLLVQPEAVISLSMVYLIIGIILTLILVIVIRKQLKASGKMIIRLNNAINIRLSDIEQVDQLTELLSKEKDPDAFNLIKSIMTSFEQFIQQKKTLNLKIRKLQENELRLKTTASSLSNERDSAIAAPRLKSEFLSRMGDEITTPMKSVVSMLKLLSEYQLENEARQLLNIAKRSTRTLVDNLNNILDFSKLDAQMLRLSPSKFSVRQLVDDLSSELSHFANEKGLSLQASSDPAIPSEVEADLSRVRQILRNLLSNAIRFTKSGEVTLYADLLTKDNKQYLRFSIKDTGVGIPAEAQKDLFDSLQQSTKLTNSSFAGRLRLIVSKYLAELMGGEIGVFSEVGKGSKFWFTIDFN